MQTPLVPNALEQSRLVLTLPLTRAHAKKAFPSQPTPARWALGRAGVTNDWSEMLVWSALALAAVSVVVASFAQALFAH